MGKKIGSTLLVGLVVMLGFAATASAREWDGDGRAEHGRAEYGRTEDGRRADFERQTHWRHELREQGRFGHEHWSHERQERMPARRAYLRPGSFRFYRAR